MSSIGRVSGTRAEPTDDHWDAERSEIVIDADQFGAESLAGLDQFSHVLVVYLMHGVAPDDVETRARHPRNNSAWPKVGIFAQRAKRRPNRIGISCCRLLAIDGLRLRVEGLDAIDGTPVLDIKPWVREFGPRGEVTQPAWMTEIMKEYY